MHNEVGSCAEILPRFLRGKASAVTTVSGTLIF